MQIVRLYYVGKSNGIANLDGRVCSALGLTRKFSLVAESVETNHWYSMVEVAGRVRFEDPELHRPEFLDIHEVLQAASHPSVEQFTRYSLYSLLSLSPTMQMWIGKIII